MKKLILVSIAIFALVGCGGGSSNSDVASLVSGSLDKTFANNGVKTDGGANIDYINYLKCKADNSILTAGATYKSNGESDSILSQYDNSGALDNGFANSGKMISGLSNDDEVKKLATDSNGNIYLVGYSSTNSNGDNEFMLAKFKPDGNIDNSFGNSGMVKEWIIGDIIKGRAIAVHNNYIIVGSVNKTQKQVTISKYDFNGNIDFNFGIGIGGSNNNDIDINDLVIDSSGNTYIVGWIQNSDKDIEIIKLKPNGQLDASFNNSGVKTIDSGNGDDKGMAIKLDNSGHIIVAGISNQYMFLARLNSDGSLDTGFGNNGMIVYNKESMAYDIALDSNENILVTGTIVNTNTWESVMSIWKYDITGNLVTSFGNNGVAKFDTGRHNNAGYAIDIDGNGKIVVGGISEQNQNDLQATIWRVNP